MSAKSHTTHLKHDLGVNNFDFLRFFLASSVIFHHAYPLLHGPSAIDPLGRLTNGQVRTGALAVDFFFVISGFLVTQSWLSSRGVRDYMKKRILRIYPALLVVFLFCLFIVAPLGGASWNDYLNNAETYQFLQPLLLQNLHDRLPGVFEDLPYPRAVNGSLWSIRYEIVCYILLALLGVAGAFRSRWIVAGLLAAAYASFVANLYLGLRIPILHKDADWSRLVVFFLAGSVLHLHWERIPRSALLFALSLVLLWAASVWGFLMAALPIVGAYALLCLAYSRLLNLQNFGRRGDLSYGIYLYGFPVQQLLVFYFAPGLTVFTLTLTALPITILLAALSWHYIEAPCLRLKRRVRPIAPNPGALKPLQHAG